MGKDEDGKVGSPIDLAPHHKNGLSLTHPVLNASGILGFSTEYRGLVNFARLGAFVTNAITWQPRTPAHSPNVLLQPTGVLIHTGLPNPGVRVALRRWTRDWARLGPPVLVHLAATSPSDVAHAIEVLERSEAVSGIELGVHDDIRADDLAALIRAGWGGPPLVVRLPLHRASELSPTAARAGAEALVVGAPPRIQTNAGSGRFYGPEIFPTALEAVRAVQGQNLEIPLVGAGGIFSLEQAQQMLAVGAVAIQVDAWAWQDPGCWDTLAPLQ